MLPAKHREATLIQLLCRPPPRVRYKFSSLARRPVHLSASQQMQMDMEQRLATVLVAIHDEAIAVVGEALLLCPTGGSEEQFADQRGVLSAQVVECRDGVRGNEQHVHRRLRVDVG